MLWYKSWLETRWRFAIGLVLLICSAGATVLAYPTVVKLLPLVPSAGFGGGLGGEIERQVTEAVALARDYRGYVWSQWFMKDMPHMWLLFAVLLGSGGLRSQASGGGALFTLSLPVSRNRLLGVRGATGLAELLVLALIPSLVVPLLSPSIGESYAIGDALVHSACLFISGAAFFSLSFFLSTEFSDVWRPPLIALGIAITLGLIEQVFRGLSPYGLFRVMSAESYFRGGGLPWLGLFASAAVSAAMLYAAARNIARQDF